MNNINNTLDHMISWKIFVAHLIVGMSTSGIDALLDMPWHTPNQIQTRTTPKREPKHEFTGFTHNIVLEPME